MGVCSNSVLSSCYDVKVNPAKHIYSSVLRVIHTKMYTKWCFSLVLHASDSLFDSKVSSIHRRTKISFTWF